MDRIFAQLEKELKFNYINEGEDIPIGDIPIDRKLWEIYYIYLEYVNYYLDKMEEFRTVKYDD